MNTDLETQLALTATQRGMLFHYISSPHAGVDIEQIVGELSEPVDPEILRAAWQDVVDRHQALRMSVRWEDVEEPRQRVHADVQAPFEFRDWRDAADANEIESRLERFLVDDRARGFDLACGPLTRLLLAKTGDERFALVWTVHHVVADGRAFPVVLEDLFRFYEARQRGEQLALPSALDLAVFVDRQAQLIRDSAAGFWAELLRGVDSPTPLPPGSATRAAAGDALFDTAELRIPESLTNTLRRVAAEHDVRMSTLVHAAWALVLSRNSGEDRVVFGSTRACRAGVTEGAESLVGMCINTLPIAVRIDPDLEIGDWLREIRAQQVEIGPYEHTPLVDVRRYSDLPASAQPFETILVFDNESVGASMRRRGEAWESRNFYLVEYSGYPLTLYAYAEDSLALKLTFDSSRFQQHQAERLLGQVSTVLASLTDGSRGRVDQLEMLSAEESRILLDEWNRTETDYDRATTVHALFEAQAARSPDAIAVACLGDEIRYAELDRRTNQLAGYLRERGIGPDQLVAVCTTRGIDMLVAVLGVMKAGGAYVPLDPAYPTDRIAYVLEDSGASLVLTQEKLLAHLPDTGAERFCLDRDWGRLESFPGHALTPMGDPHNLAYVIYTSGSTGRPKGVMVEQRNVVNFFAGMDATVPTSSEHSDDAQESWLAVTSLSFDISVLELLWTLTRGFKVVVHVDETEAPPTERLTRDPGTQIDFGLFYFASSEGSEESDPYRLLLEGARFADERGFSFVSIPERHFHAFGGIYPNPAIAAAAVATATSRVQVRAGSCVLPLHNPVRVAEDWAFVDRISGGRAGVAFASGWQPNDFVLAPDAYSKRRDLTYEGIEKIRALWQGKALHLTNPMGDEVETRTLPQPIQAELPIWITTAGNAETWQQAARCGAGVLTHLLGQSVEEVAENIRLYREERKRSGHEGNGTITLMLHTFVGESDDEVREKVREPMKRYLASSVSLIKDFTSSFPAFRGRAEVGDLDLEELSDEDMDAILEYSFDRYFESSTLFGSVERCLGVVDRLKSIGVDEIAALIDFGVDDEEVLRSLDALDRLREASNQSSTEARLPSIAESVEAHAITHMQCTPSMATMLLLDEEARASLRGLRTLLIGGEAFPASLARDLRSITGPDTLILNMYGPTETTIWSALHRVEEGEPSIPIGRPIANTGFYVLDRDRALAPVGVPGELYISGEGVVRGYHGRPELTRAAFVDDPFRPGSSIYRTGDLVRYREDGALEFLGRLDHQVKIRGHRIELGEIESVIRDDGNVKEAVVVAREDQPGDQRLVGYLTARQGREFDLDAIRERMAAKLPSFMVPWKLIELEALPLTPNAKIDRKALPAPREAGLALPRARSSPRGAVEEDVSRIWRQVLGLERFGVEENFFDLGGHSLLVVRVQKEIREQLGLRLPLVELFRSPTVRALSARVAALQGVPDGQPAPASKSGARARAEARRNARAQRGGEPD